MTLPALLWALSACVEGDLVLEGGPCPGVVQDDRFDLDEPVDGASARDIAVAASGPRATELLRDDVRLGDDMFHWTFEARRAELYELTGGEHWYDRDAVCPVGAALKVRVRADLMSDAGFEGDGDGHLWFAEGQVWANVNGDLREWPATTPTLGQPAPICQGEPTTRVRFGTLGDLAQDEALWEGAPQGQFSHGRRHCVAVDFGWVHPDGG